jgi:hypothetical protein
MQKTGTGTNLIIVSPYFGRIHEDMLLCPYDRGEEQEEPCSPHPDSDTLVYSSIQTTIP